MLADAVRAEGYRLGRNRMTVFWGLLFIPLMAAVGGPLFAWFNARRAEEMTAGAQIPAGMGQEPLNLFEGVTAAAAMGANGIVLVFSLIVAAALYAGDYRWETWRLISARNSRTNLIVGKVIVMGLVALIGLFLFQAAMMIFGISEAMANDHALVFETDAGLVGEAVLLAGLSWLRIMQFVMLGLLAAVLTRSLLAALFIPFVVGFGQSLLGSIGLPLLGWEATDWVARLLLPGSAFDVLKMAVSDAGNPIAAAGAAPPMSAPPRIEVIKSAISLGLWTLVPFVAALAWFQRQDLSKE